MRQWFQLGAVGGARTRRVSYCGVRECASLIIQPAREPALLKIKPQVQHRHTEPSLSDTSLVFCRLTQRQQRRKDDLVAHLYALDPPPVPRKPSFFTFDSHIDTMEVPVPRTDMIISRLLLFSQIGKKLGEKNLVLTVVQACDAVDALNAVTD